MAAFFRKRSSSRAAGARQVLNLNSMPAESGRRVLPPSPGARMAAARPFRRPAGISSLPSFNWTLCSPGPEEQLRLPEGDAALLRHVQRLRRADAGAFIPPGGIQARRSVRAQNGHGIADRPPFRSAGSVKLSLVSSPSCSAKASIRTSPAPTSSGPS